MSRNIRRPEPPKGWHEELVGPVMAEPTTLLWVRNGYRAVRCQARAHDRESPLDVRRPGCSKCVGGFVAEKVKP